MTNEITLPLLATSRRRPLTPLARPAAVFALLALFIATFLTDSRAQAPPASARPDIASKIEKLLADPELKGGIQGVMVRSLKDGTTWYERNADLLFMPASNQKLATSSAALALLGPDFRYATRLVRTGELGADGVLQGDLVLLGSGDPTIENADLDALVAAVRRAGVKRMSGRVLGEDSRFDAVRYGDGWSWDYLSDYYAAEVGALTMDRGVVLIKVEPGPAAGELVKVSLTPAEGYPTVVVRATTAAAGAKSALNVERALGTNTILVTGTMPLDGKAESVPTTIDRPARYVATVLAARLRKAGVAVDGDAGETRTPPTSATEVARHTSAPLSAILPKFLKPSDNLIGECLLKTLGAEKGKAGTVEEGARVATDWFKSQGIDTTGFSIADGSGLSRMNGVSPRALLGIVVAMHKHPNGKVWYDSLPIAGVDGSLRNRMKDTRAASNCHAKTGYIGWVSSLSGYVTTRDGEQLAFVMLMNNHRCRNASCTGIQNRIVELLADTTSGSP